MARIPRRVVIEGVPFTVSKFDLSRDDGKCYYHAQEIVVGDHLGHDLERETLFHELLHACEFMSGAGSHLSERTLENHIRRLSPVLYSTLRHNVPLRAYLFLNEH